MVDVFITRELEDLMVGEDDDTSFDHWIHNQLLSSRGTYNQV